MVQKYRRYLPWLTIHSNRLQKCLISIISRADKAVDEVWLRNGSLDIYDRRGVV